MQRHTLAFVFLGSAMAILAGCGAGGGQLAVAGGDMLAPSLPSTTVTNDSGSYVGTPGSGSSTADTGGDEAAARAEVVDAMASEELAYLFADDEVLAGEEDAAAQAEGVVRRPWWFRRLEIEDRIVEVDVEGDTAMVTYRVEVGGVLRVDADHDRVYGRKTIDSSAIRYARFVKRESGGGDASAEGLANWRKWRLAALSANEVDLADPSRQTVDILETALIVDGTEVARVSDPSQLVNLSELPRLVAGTRVVVEATCQVGDGGAVFLHLPRSNALAAHRRVRLGHVRVPMADDGTGADRVAGDGIYTAAFRPALPRGLDKLGVDILSSATLADETTENYDSGTWIIPYAVVRTSTDAAPDDGA